MNVTLVHQYFFSRHPFTFSPHILLLILLLILPCLFLNLTILLKILLKPHLWSFINDQRCGFNSIFNKMVRFRNRHGRIRSKMRRRKYGEKVEGLLEKKYWWTTVTFIICSLYWWKFQDSFSWELTLILEKVYFWNIPLYPLSNMVTTSQIMLFTSLDLIGGRVLCSE